MSLYEDRLSEYYDMMYSGKDYDHECKMIVSLCEKRGRLLDVGCGTLTHSLILSNYFESIVAVDLSEKMIEFGKRKLISAGVSNIAAKRCDVKALKNESKFDAAIAMFNVVNHIDKASELNQFLRSISDLLSDDGLLIFDCWNGIASVKDVPRELSEKNLMANKVDLRISTLTKTDLMLSRVNMVTDVVVKSNSNEIDSFSYSLSHRLWMPGDLYEMVEDTGMRVSRLIPSFDVSRDANQQDHRITFICRKSS
jgi:SAM-dependent methyltransferase